VFHLEGEWSTVVYWKESSSMKEFQNASKREREWEEYSDDKAFYSFLFTARILENTVRLRKWGSILLT
jgi:hypothetical protein